MNYFALDLVEATRKPGDFSGIQAISNRKVDPTLIPHFLSFILRVHGGGNDLNTLLLQLRSLNEGCQLLPAIVSPVASV